MVGAWEDRSERVVSSWETTTPKPPPPRKLIPRSDYGLEWWQQETNKSTIVADVNRTYNLTKYIVGDNPVVLTMLVRPGLDGNRWARIFTYL